MEIIEQDDRLNLDEFLTRPLYAFLASMSGNGACCSPVWFLWEDKKIWIISVKGDSFAKRVNESPNCSISIVDWDKDSGKSQHIGLRGTAELDEFDKVKANRLLSKYLGSEVLKWPQRFVDFQNSPGNVLVRFTPKSVVVRDQSYRFRG
ncbi:pyridoxamine 5'-phosphate oxidase family protein [Vibrio penaeicida]|uniref:Pyridoxamine 5'-phosphate oxidase N-terminal domain-containing protein n=1 Tax=Vibrio penaeicida TaxID=104609 RepID=A0AAV5NJM7_9VIBR|nr:pyridoxamine 5'-phosphate oxidase family protein [Vibrio penaeicida]RTZ23636.1 pyridoxamine 5'-phosphate oxidase family protein [Vibrio penaeicida]GLQ70840.1 hypothetical protein GCM10007932_02000 [Vibrio penaeicida]